MILDERVIFPNEGWSVIVDEVKLSRIDPDTLYNHMMFLSLRNDWARKGGISIKRVREIDWDNFGKAFVSCKFAQQ